MPDSSQLGCRRSKTICQLLFVENQLCTASYIDINWRSVRTCVEDSNEGVLSKTCGDETDEENESLCSHC